VLAAVDRGEVGRRRLLIGSLGTAGAAVGAGLLSQLRSVGPAPASLSHTAWRDRLTLVTEDGSPVHVADIPYGSIVTVFPQGFTSSPQVPALLIHLRPGVNKPLAGRATWAPDGLVCYSKICSHAGCAVGLYNHLTHELTCPCHQSTFNVTRGAAPTFGPAGGPLAQLPIQLQPDGTMRSAGDFSNPPGPVFWHRRGS
jgi:ubiquinol-cytochrome c reductase iron-sulfur subunit